MRKNGKKNFLPLGLARIRTRVAGSKVRRSTNWATGAEKKIRQKFSPNWFENFLFSKTFEFRLIFMYILDISTQSFWPNFFSALIAQLVERRTLDPATRVRIPVAQLFSFSFFHFFLITFLSNIDIGHIFSLVNIFLSTFLQALYLVTQMVFFQKC